MINLLIYAEVLNKIIRFILNKLAIMLFQILLALFIYLLSANSVSQSNSKTVFASSELKKIN